MYCVEINNSRRNTRRAIETNLLRLQISRCLRKIGGARQVGGIRCMTAGIKINGRAFSSGSHWLYVDRIRQQRPDAADDSSSYHVGTVDKFFTLQYKKRAGAARTQTLVFAAIVEQTVQARVEGMFIIRSHAEGELAAVTAYINIDHITHKVKQHPHWTDERLWIGLPVFESI